jgi:membrane protease YdiL (CAAX protease family)
MAEDADRQLQRALCFVALALMAVSAAVGPHRDISIRAAPPTLAALVAVFGLLHPGPGAAVAVLGAAISIAAATGLAWQATMPIALAAFLFVLPARPALGPLREPVGRVPAWGTFACAAVTPVALAAWFVLFGADLGDITRRLRELGPTELALGAAGFVLVNAFCEELIWRGVIQSRLTALLPERDAIFVQAISFGAQHVHGFPRGAAGVVLASVWAIGLGMLRRSAGGLLAPILAHIVADATIAAIVIFWAR